MKTQEFLQGWKKYWTSSFLILVAIVVLIITKYSFFAIQVNNDLNLKLNEVQLDKEQLNGSPVILVNDEVLVNNSSRIDTIYIRIKQPTSQMVEVVDSIENDTINSLKLEIK